MQTLILILYQLISGSRQNFRVGDNLIRMFAELQQVAENQPAAQEEDSRRDAETAEDVASQNEAVPVEVEKAAPRKDSASPAPLRENSQARKSDSREVAKPAMENQERSE